MFNKSGAPSCKNETRSHYNITTLNAVGYCTELSLFSPLPHRTLMQLSLPGKSLEIPSW